MIGGGNIFVILERVELQLEAGFRIHDSPKAVGGGEWDLDADMKVKALRGRFDADDYAAHVSGDQ